MLETVEAVIDTQGRVRLLEKVKLTGKRRALVTILDENETSAAGKTIVGSMDLLDENLGQGSLQIRQALNKSIEDSAENL